MKASGIRSSLLALAAMTALAGCAQTAPSASSPVANSCQGSGPCGPAGMRPDRPRLTPEQRQAMFEQRTAKQAEVLAITPAQRPQWDAYVAAKRGMFTAMPMGGGDPAARRAAFERMTPDQRAQFRLERMNAMADHMKRMANAEVQLRNVLSPDQRQRFDAMQDRHMRHMKHGRFGQAPGWRASAPVAN